MSDISSRSVATVVSDKVVEFRLGSYNLRMGHLDTDEDNKWSVRRPRLMESIRRQAFDVAGLQEVNSLMQSDLEEEFGGIYNFWFFSPYSQDGVGGQGSRHYVQVIRVPYLRKAFLLGFVHTGCLLCD